MRSFLGVLTFILLGSSLLITKSGHTAGIPFKKTSIRFKLPSILQGEYCKDRKHRSLFELQTQKNHRNIKIKAVPGQKLLSIQETLAKLGVANDPHDDPKASSLGNYVYSVSLEDLTNGNLKKGYIAFDSLFVNHAHFYEPDNAIIFTDDFPMGISRSKFIAELTDTERQIANSGLDTFLTLFPLFQYAVEACRHRLDLGYATSDEGERIKETAIRVFKLAQQFNSGTLPLNARKVQGYQDGFVDPDFRFDSGLGFEFAFLDQNPLNFPKPISIISSGQENIKEYNPNRISQDKAVCKSYVQKGEEYFLKELQPMLGQAQVIAEEYKHVLARLSDKKLLNLLSAIYIEKLSEATPGQIFELISEETLNSSQGQLVSYESESPCSKPSSGGLLICTFSKRLVKQINGTMYSMNISSNSFMNSFNFSICADSKPDTYYELMAGKPLCYFSKINARLTKRLLTKKPVMLDGQDILKSQIQILAEFLSRRSAGRCKEAIQENFQLHIQTSNL